MTLVDIMAQLKEPFLFDDIDLLPKGSIERDGKTLCMALPYADPRVYQDRLNTIAYGEWSTPPPVVIAAGNKLICYVTVVLCGVPHTDVGEATLKAASGKDEENTGTEAWAQAFKRACSQFGLGRYLYDLDKEWVPYNPQRKMIDLDAAGKRAIVRKMYQKAGLLEAPPQKASTTRKSEQVSSTSTSTGNATSQPSGDVVEAKKSEWLGVYEQGKKSGKWKDVSEFYAKVGGLFDEKNVNKAFLDGLDTFQLSYLKRETEKQSAA